MCQNYLQDLEKHGRWAHPETDTTDRRMGPDPGALRSSGSFRHGGAAGLGPPLGTVS